MFTASPSPASVATSLAALRKLKAEPERRERLRANSERLYHGFKSLGLTLGCQTTSPVIAVICSDEVTTIGMWKALLDAGVYVNIALPPGTPPVVAAASAGGLRRNTSVSGSMAAMQKMPTPR